MPQLALVVVAALALWGLVDPRSQWRALKSWQYRNPAANEPSDAAYAIARLVSGVVLLAGVWLLASGSVA